MNNKPTILTGIKNSGRLHIGSYLGAIKPMVELQQKHVAGGEMTMNMFIPDLHSLTVPADYAELYRHTIDNIKLYIACGFDTAEGTLLYRQSAVPAHSQMCVLLNNFTYFGELSRQTQFKDKAENESVSVGMFDYPVLMAADILLYGAEYVPVGEDQRQHLELARDIAERINNKFEREIFALPKTITEQAEFAGHDKALRIMSLAHPDQKMSKSVKDPRGTIDLLDEPSVARKKIMSAETDSLASVNYDPECQPGVSNLIEIYANYTDQSIETAEAEFKGSERYGDLKSKVADTVCAFLEQIQTKYHDISDDQVLALLTRDEPKAAVIANKTLDKLERALKLKTRADAKSAAKPAEIAYDDFAKLDIRIGTVAAAETVDGADKLIKLTVDVGENAPRTILTGMREFYEPDHFVDRQVTVLCNLAPREMRGTTSHGMILAVDGPDRPILIHPDETTSNGAPIA